MEIIYVVGPPGTGKTTGASKLNPAETFIINADYKSLSFRGGKKNYSKEKGNYIELSDPVKVKDWIYKAADAQVKGGAYKFKNIIIDTANAIMNDVEMGIRTNASATMTHKEWYELAKYIYDMIKPLHKDLKRDDLYIFFLFHEGTDDAGVRGVLSNGRKLEKIQLEGLVNWCFFTSVEGDKYELLTRNTGEAKAKRKADAFPDTIPNDYQAIVDGIRAFEDGE